MGKVLLTLAAALFYVEAATNFVLIDEELQLTSIDGKTLFVGAPVKIISDEGDNALIEIEGYVNPAKKDTLYATKNFKIPFATGENIVVTGEKGLIQAKVSHDNIDEDEEYAWEYSADIFYAKCTQCHAAPEINSHTMLEWEGLFSSMKQFAQPSDKEEATILRFLRSFAKDGYTIQK
jgi:trimethylamine-N-oxide reductase cytochrome c-type subunit TorC